MPIVRAIIKASAKQDGNDATGRTTESESATPIQGGDMGNAKEAKQGRLCCRVCCDMRRAVIILSLLGIILSIITLLTNFFVLFRGLDWNQEQNTVEEQEDIERLQNLFWKQFGLTIGSLISYALAIYGSVYYRNTPILCNMAYVVFNFAYSTTILMRAQDDIEDFGFSGANVVGPAIGMIMTLYANASLVYEIRSGIMSEETYKIREEHSCCCV